MNEQNRPNHAPDHTAARQAMWERDLLERLAFAAVAEQRKSRRWGIFKFLFIAAFLLLVFTSLLAVPLVLDGKPSASRYTALIELNGIIEPDGEASADFVITGLRAAFEDDATAGVVVRANSPGGSPVQAAYINDEIRRLRKKFPKIPLHAVITDVCASGCYYVVVAADQIYANEASVVGSIGVLMDGFGFVDSMKKLGIERRLLTAGEHKGVLDPFSPMQAFDRRHAQLLLDQIHQQFIARVRDGRGQALQESKETFSGLFWTGEEALKMGLVDALGSASYVAREVIGAEDIVDFTYRERLLDRFARRIGSAMVNALEMRLWSGAPSLK